MQSVFAVVLTALPVEYAAVKALLIDLQPHDHPAGSVYEIGTFSYGDQKSFRVAINEVGKGNNAAAIETERAISRFSPKYVLLVGVAGGIKDVSLGDVVAATKAYGYASGKARGNKFEIRPDLGISSHALLARARFEAREPRWRNFLASTVDSSSPKALVGPIAAGEVVVSSKRSAISQFLKQSYGDAVAVEMEGRGFLEGAYHNASEALVVRGISDLLERKKQSDAAGSQRIASQHAAAFAFAVLSGMAESRDRRVASAVELPVSDLPPLEPKKRRRKSISRELEFQSNVNDFRRLYGIASDDAWSQFEAVFRDPKKRASVTILAHYVAQADQDEAAGLAAALALGAVKSRDPANFGANELSELLFKHFESVRLAAANSLLARCSHLSPAKRDSLLDILRRRIHDESSPVVRNALDKVIRCIAPANLETAPALQLYSAGDVNERLRELLLLWQLSTGRVIRTRGFLQRTASAVAAAVVMPEDLKEELRARLSLQLISSQSMMWEFGGSAVQELRSIVLKYFRPDSVVNRMVAYGTEALRHLLNTPGLDVDDNASFQLISELNAKGAQI